MRKMLFLDDMEERHKAVVEFGERHMWEITHVYTADEAITELDKGGWGIVSLDHDLSLDTIMTEPELGEKSGYDVAMHIANMPENIRPKAVVIHSWNPNGAKRMEQAMKGKVEVVTIIPFRA